MSILSKYIKTAGSGVVSKIVLAGSGILALYLLNRILDKADFGTFMIAIAISKILTLMVSSGFSGVLLYRVSRMSDAAVDDDTSRRMLGTSLAYGVSAAIIVSVGLYFTASLVSVTAHKPELSAWLVAGCIIIPCDAVRFIVSAWHRALQRVHISIMFTDVLPAALLPVFLSVFWLSDLFEFNPLVAGVVYAASNILPSILLLALWPLRIRLRTPVFSKWDVGYGAKMLLTQLMTQPARQVDILLVGFLASPEITAEYVLASRLAQFVMMSKNLFSQLLVPRMGYLLQKADDVTLKAEYDSARSVSLLAALLITGGYACFAPQLISSFGDYNDVSTLLLLAAAMLVRVAAGSSGSYLTMAGYAGWSLTTSIMGLVVNFSMAFLLVPAFGASGAATAFLLSVLVQNAFTVWSAWSLDRFSALNWHTLFVLLAAMVLLILQANGAISAVLSTTGIVALLAMMIFNSRKAVSMLRRRFVRRLA